MAPTLLLCTVGGSHRPILTAIEQRRPDQVVFFGTGPDPATGRPGSLTQILGKGTPVEERGADGQVKKLPNIPTLAGLAEGKYEAREVPADDLDGAVVVMRNAVQELRQRFPAAVFIADYTGGTKTMTAALVITALEAEGVELQLVTGSRGDLVRVRDGSQASITVGVEGIRLRRAMAPYLAAWERHGYAEAAAGLRGLALPRDSALRGELLIARDLSCAFDAWDRFDHAAARRILEDYRVRIGQKQGHLIAFLGMLLAQDPRQTPAQLWDLWLNARRKGTQARYDDAIARLYRLTEWTAQWFLARQGILTADLNPAQLPADFDLRPTREGKYKAGLLDAWRLAAHHVGGDVATFYHQEGERLRHHLLARNASILAHGTRPIQRQDWDDYATWAEGHLLPLIEREAQAAGFRMRPPQLPQQPIW
jgi:CRISPR-associated protein (TIGR02710 family)